MASLTVAEIRAYVRAYLDTDEEELPDALLDVWRDEGTARIQRTFEPWSFYKSDWSLTTSTQRNDFDSLGVATNGEPSPSLPSFTMATADSIVGVYDIETGYTLRSLAHDAARRIYTQMTSATGTPTAWSVDQDALWLWPIPSDSFEYTVSGYRRPIDVSVDTDTLDLPAEFSPLVAEWTLARAYEQMDDEIMSAQKFGRFEQLLDGFRRRYLRTPRTGIEAIGQNPSGGGEWGVPSRLRYDWEF